MWHTCGDWMQVQFKIRHLESVSQEGLGWDGPCRIQKEGKALLHSVPAGVLQALLNSSRL